VQRLPKLRVKDVDREYLHTTRGKDYILCKYIATKFKGHPNVKVKLYSKEDTIYEFVSISITFRELHVSTSLKIIEYIKSFIKSISGIYNVVVSLNNSRFDTESRSEECIVRFIKSKLRVYIIPF